MKNLNKNKLPGFWILIITGLLLLASLILGQMMSFINYDFPVSLGLQEPVNVVGETAVAVNKAFGLGDTIIYIPLLVFGLIGLWLKKEWGVYSMLCALGITAYWPMVSLFFFFFAKGTPGFYFSNYFSYTILLIVFTAYGLWGIWYIYKNRKLLYKD
ncbi:MAG: hypothetical protein WC644_02455 [Ignavibacteria bacterium]